MSFNWGIWAIFYLVFTLLLYFGSIKDEWNNMRIKQGLVEHGSVKRPKFYDKNKFTNKRYIWYCARLFLVCLFLSFIIMVGALLILPSTKFENEIEFFRTIIFLLIIYSVFMGIANEMENIDSDQNGLVKTIFRIFNSLKSSLLQTIINDEYEDIKEMINNIIKEWEQKRTTKNDKIGSTILRLNKFVINNRKESVEESIIDRVNDLIYDLYNTYIDDEDEFIMDDINNLIDKLILDKMGINIIDLALFLKYQPTKAMTKEKIKMKMRLVLADSKNEQQEQEASEISAEELRSQV